MTNEHTPEMQEAQQLLQALERSSGLSHDQAQELLPAFVEAERAGEDVDSLPEYAELLRHLDTCGTCMEFYLSLAEDLETLVETDAPIPMSPIPSGLFTPKPVAEPLPKAKRAELFARDQLANRAAVHEITWNTLAQVAPKQPKASLAKLDLLLDKAAQGQMSSGSQGQPAFALGDWKLIVQVVVPLVVDYLAHTLWKWRVDTINGLAQTGVIPELSETRVHDLLRQAGFRLDPAQIQNLTSAINQAVRAFLEKEAGA